VGAEFVLLMFVSQLRRGVPSWATGVCSPAEGRGGEWHHHRAQWLLTQPRVVACSLFLRACSSALGSVVGIARCTSRRWVRVCGCMKSRATGGWNRPSTPYTQACAAPRGQNSHYTTYTTLHNTAYSTPIASHSRERRGPIRRRLSASVQAQQPCRERRGRETSGPRRADLVQRLDSERGVPGRVWAGSCPVRCSVQTAMLKRDDTLARARWERGVGVGVGFSSVSG
jgi:hypothetical protein